MDFKVNINDYIKVKLNDEGIKILHDRHDELSQLIKTRGGKGLGEFHLTVDKEGYTKFQMWSFIETFSPHMNFCLELPFDANIIVTNGTPVDSWLMEKK